MKKSEIFLNSKKTTIINDLVTIEHAKTYGKIVELEERIRWEDRLSNVTSMESKIETLMKS